MLRDLPEFVQQQVLDYLTSDNFVAAKSLHDAWIRQQGGRRRFDVKNGEIGNLAADFNFMSQQKIIRIEEMLSSD